MGERLAAEIGTLCDERGWSRVRFIRELRQAAQVAGAQLPSDKSLERMIRQWRSGDRGLSDFYAKILEAVFQVPFSRTKAPEVGKPADEASLALLERLQSAASVDGELVVLLEDQTQSYRSLDRRLGAERTLGQTVAHTGNILDLFKHSLPGAHRSTLAAATAEAAALAGWQALDLGDLDKAWELHETAKSAARESGSPAVLAHVTAQQGYVLLDADRSADALTLMQHARTEAAGRVPPLLQSWLWAAEAESLAAGGHKRAARRALDSSAAILPQEGGEDLPYVFLNEVHLSRWRGHCLARLGAVEAVEDLTSALDRLDPTFTRAAAGLHCDLALALAVQGQRDEAQAEARKADTLARQMTSRRQRRRIKRLLPGDPVRLDH